MYIGQIGLLNHRAFSMPKQSDLAQLANHFQSQKTQPNTDTVNICSNLSEKSSQDDETGIYKRDNSSMHSLFPDGITYTEMEPDKRLQAEILPASEKDSYTEKDALLNQYMKQYRLEGKIENGTFIQTSDGPARLMLPDLVSDSDLETFRQELVKNGLNQEIDWKGVKDDLSHMGVGFDNADRLEMKADYLASRYAVLKDRIQTQYSGDAKEEQMDILNNIFNDSKNEMADVYAQQIGGFYEDLGQTGAAGDMRDSILALVEQKVTAYEAQISKNPEYSNAITQENSWLKQDDAFMASKLRESMSLTEESTEAKANPGKYNANDLTFAGVNAQALNTQLNELSEQWYNSTDDSALGATLAAQKQEILNAISTEGVSGDMRMLIDQAFKPYMDKVMDTLDDRIDKQKDKVQNKPYLSGMVRTSYIDRNSVYSAFQNAMTNYKN